MTTTPQGLNNTIIKGNILYILLRAMVCHNIYIYGISFSFLPPTMRLAGFEPAVARTLSEVTYNSRTLLISVGCLHRIWPQAHGGQVGILTRIACWTGTYAVVTSPSQCETRLDSNQQRTELAYLPASLSAFVRRSTVLVTHRRGFPLRPLVS